ncbi:hypothetical protein BC628DRAFT_1426212 [Trametes gibbosa]|nr:hypothetical protein BC628DRAFT_1426212 [Trametes gibbosa]
MSDAIMPMIKNAERNNDKLFPVFQKNLSSNSSTEFGTAAEKLSGWLSRDKAYYSKARPQTAQETVRRHSGTSVPFHISRSTDDIKPWAEPYIKLLRTVIPFYLLFPERSLQPCRLLALVRMRMLIQAVCDNVDAFLSEQRLFSPPAANSPTQSTLFEHSRSSSGAFLPDPATPIPSVQPNMNPEQSRPKAKRRKTWVDTDFIQADLNWFRDRHTTETPTTLPIATQPPDDGRPTVDTVSTAPTVADETPSEPAVLEAAPPQPSRSPRAALQEVAQPHVALYPASMPVAGPSVQPVDQSAMAHSLVALGPSITRRPADVDGPAKLESSVVPIKAPSPLDGDKLPSPLTTRKPKKRKRGPPGLKVLPMPFEERPPELVSTEKSTSTDEAPTTTRESSASAAAPPASTALAPPPLLKDPPGARVDGPPGTLATTATPDHTQPESRVRAGSPAPMDLDSNTRPPQNAPTSALDGPSHFAAPLENDGDVEMSDTPSVVTAEVTMTDAVSAVREATLVSSLPPLLCSRVMDTSISSPSWATHSRSDTVSSAPPTSDKTASNSDVHGTMASAQSPAAVPPAALGSGISQDQANGTNAVVEEGTQTATDMQMGATTIEQVGSATNTLAAQQSPFASTSARVLSIARGASSMTPASLPVVLKFELSLEEFAQLARWKNRSSKQYDDLSASLCISLVIYPVSRFKDDLPESPGGTQEVKGYGRPAPWPRDGSVFVAMNPDEDGERGERYTIAPPFVTTVDKCVDLHTPSVHAGVNTLHIFQYRDHSERVFAAIIHHPTPAQLAELQAARDKERGWRQCLERIGRIELQVPRLFPTSMLAGVEQSPPP